MPGPCSSPTIFPTRWRPSTLSPCFPLVHESCVYTWTLPCGALVSTHASAAALCTLHPRALAPGVQRTRDTMFAICYQLEVINPCLPVQGMGGWFIYLYNSNARILHLLRNFATFGTVAKIKTFSHMRRCKTIAVQIS